MKIGFGSVWRSYPCLEQGGNNNGSQHGAVAPFRPQIPSFCDRTGQVFQLVSGHLTFTPPHMLAQGTVDARLVTPATLGMRLEPCQNIRVQPYRDLPLYWPVENAPTGIRRIEEFRNAGRVDLVIGLALQGLDLCPLILRQLNIAFFS